MTNKRSNIGISVIPLICSVLLLILHIIVAKTYWSHFNDYNAIAESAIEDAIINFLFHAFLPTIVLLAGIFSPSQKQLNHLAIANFITIGIFLLFSVISYFVSYPDYSILDLLCRTFYSLRGAKTVIYMIRSGVPSDWLYHTLIFIIPLLHYVPLITSAISLTYLSKHSSPATQPLDISAAHEHTNSVPNQQNTTDYLFCPGCGSEIHNGNQYCPKCGYAFNSTQFIRKADTPSTGLNILSFLIPLIGLILYLVMREDTPRKAGKIGKAALIGFIITVVLNIIILIL